MLKSRLKFIRLRIGFAAENQTELSPMLGSTLRGAFGHSFKKASCVMFHGNCGKCLVSSSCHYYNVFESRNISPKGMGVDAPPHPYNILPPLKFIFLKNEIMYFQFTLFGENTAALPYLIYSFQIMGENGLGKGRKKFELVSVQDFYTREEALDGTSFRMDRIPVRDLGETVSENLSAESRNLISFITPLRILLKGKIIRNLDSLTFRQNIQRRFRNMTSLYGSYAEEDMADLENFGVEELEAEYRRWRRYSARQNKTINQDGILGRWIISPGSCKNHALLKAYQILYMGKSTSFGLGKFLMRELKPPVVEQRMFMFSKKV